VTTESEVSTWLGEVHELSITRLQELSGLPAHELQELVDCGALQPLDETAAPLVFASHCLLTVRTATRLRRSFELEPHGLALAVSLLERIRDLEAQLEQVRAQLPRSFR